jgi:N-acetylmuramoyl-L-alanine amidase
VINTLSLRIRSGPGTNYSIIGGYWSGNKVSVLETSGDWGRTDKGWINLLYTLPVQSSYVVTTAYLTIREFASAYSKAVGWLKLGDHVFEVQRVNEWVNIGRGWVNGSYLKPV